MNWKSVWSMGIKLVVLTLLLYLCFTAASTLAGLNTPITPEEGTRAAKLLLLVCAIDTVALSYPVVRSRWRGWVLVLTVFAVFFGVMTFLSQIETVLFLNYLVSIVPPDLTPKLFLQGAVLAGFFSPLVVLVHGKLRGREESWVNNRRLVMTRREWVWKLALLSVIYVGVYFIFGRLVFLPLAGEAFYQYYANLQLPAWILAFQLVRGLIWVALALPVVRMMKGAWWETGLALSLLFSGLMGSLLILPNPLMPDAVRIPHLVEVTTSNFVYGWIVAWVLTRPGRAVSRFYTVGKYK